MPITLTPAQNLEKLTQAMWRKEAELARMTAYINAVGEAKVGADYLIQYQEEHRIWDEMRAERDRIKYQIFLESNN